MISCGPRGALSHAGAPNQCDNALTHDAAAWGHATPHGPTCVRIGRPANGAQEANQEGTMPYVRAGTGLWQTLIISPVVGDNMSTPAAMGPRRARGGTP